MRFENTSDKSWNQQQWLDSHILEEFACQLLFYRKFLNSKTDNTVELLIQEREQNSGHKVSSDRKTANLHAPLEEFPFIIILFYFLFQIRRGCSVRNFRQTTRGMRNFQLLIDGATFLLMLLFSNNFKWNHNYRSMQFAKYTNYFMGKLTSNLLWQYFHSICIAFGKCLLFQVPFVSDAVFFACIFCS